MNLEFLGSKAKDKVSGFSGIVTGAVKYLTGCAQYLITPSVDEKGTAPDARWVDEGRLEIVGANVYTQEDLVAEDNGADIQAPIR